MSSPPRNPYTGKFSAEPVKPSTKEAAKVFLPATVQKIVSEILPQIGAGDQAFAKDARDLLTECCVEFITLISTEANEISEKEAKKTIAVEHIEKALTDLGFGDYVPEVLKVANEFTDQQKVSFERPCGMILADMTSTDSREEGQQVGAEWHERAGAPGDARADVCEC